VTFVLSFLYSLRSIKYQPLSTDECHVRGKGPHLPTVRNPFCSLAGNLYVWHGPYAVLGSRTDKGKRIAHEEGSLVTPL